MENYKSATGKLDENNLSVVKMNY
jgi:hypothetical protein